jgi:hypothetical protein
MASPSVHPQEDGRAEEPDPSIPLEDFFERYPRSIRFFLDRGLSPFTCCGAPPGSLGDYLVRKDIADPAMFMRELGEFLLKTRNER